MPSWFDWLDQIQGLEQTSQIPSSFDPCGTRFSTGLEFPTIDIDTCSTALDLGFEMPPKTQFSPPNSCFPCTSILMGEEDELAVLLQHFQQTTPTRLIQPQPGFAIILHVLNAGVNIMYAESKASLLCTWSCSIWCTSWEINLHNHKRKELRFKCYPEVRFCLDKWS